MDLLAWEEAHNILSGKCLLIFGNFREREMVTKLALLVITFLGKGSRSVSYVQLLTPMVGTSVFAL